VQGVRLKLIGCRFITDAGNELIGGKCASRQLTVKESSEQVVCAPDEQAGLYVPPIKGSSGEIGAADKAARISSSVPR
jgi:hypothetical protein